MQGNVGLLRRDIAENYLFNFINGNINNNNNDDNKIDK